MEQEGKEEEEQEEKEEEKEEKEEDEREEKGPSSLLKGGPGSMDFLPQLYNLATTISSRLIAQILTWSVAFP